MTTTNEITTPTPKFRHAMVRKRKNDNSLIVFLLDTYNPKTDFIDHIDIDTNTRINARYHALHSKTSPVHIKQGSPEEKRLTPIISVDGIFDVIYLDRLVNPKSTPRSRKRHPRVLF